MTQPQGNLPGAWTPPRKKTSPLVWVLAGCGVIVLVGAVVVSAVVWWGYRQAKSYAERTLETKAGDMNRVAQLWSDVPPMEGMTQSQTEMPLALRAVARPFLDALMRGLNNGREAGHWDVAYFMSNGKTTHDVEGFYVPARMVKYGWQQQGGCANMGQATFCSFQKQEGDKRTGLLITAADDQEHKATALYFIRQEAQEKGNASGR